MTHPVSRLRVFVAALTAVGGITVLAAQARRRVLQTTAISSEVDWVKRQQRLGADCARSGGGV